MKKTFLSFGGISFSLLCEKSWRNARHFCEGLGGTSELAKIRNKGQNDLLKSMGKEVGRAIGSGKLCCSRKSPVFLKKSFVF